MKIEELRALISGMKPLPRIGESPVRMQMLGGGYVYSIAGKWVSFEEYQTACARLHLQHGDKFHPLTFS
jgi:hypothetical protein